ncbi:2-oxoacid dehydrogenase acyltransferase domain protein [Medicago truncatula]|uniref:2-oxoacid dehydrogenase acyltransferase domain protein n=1 Tax=Medicago truncatula TaxID=3880 RepID=A0A072UEA6_MEDTR|nr:2-oxoacid dehydrogenase acyltransferase domain protein [Medicago truncatula]
MLLFPTADSARLFSMLGLGDIVIPAERRVVPGSGGEEFKFASFMAVTLSCDHRVIDGAIGAEWLKAFKGCIENP